MSTVVSSIVNTVVSSIVSTVVNTVVRTVVSSIVESGRSEPAGIRAGRRLAVWPQHLDSTRSEEAEEHLLLDYFHCATAQLTFTLLLLYNVLQCYLL